MTHEEKVDMTNSLWLVTTFYKNAEEVRDELESADHSDQFLQDTRESLSHIYNALDRMTPEEAEIFKERILSGEAFKKVYYGDALQLNAEEQAACEAFAANYFPTV